MFTISSDHIAPGKGRCRHAIRTCLALGGIGALLALAAAVPARASHNQVSMFEEGTVAADPGSGLQELRHLGAGTVRWGVGWSDIAPSSGSSGRPKFNASDPGAYPAANWNQLDQVVRTTSTDGINVVLTIEGHAPRWAFGPGEPSDPHHLLGAWKPSASEFGKFVRAVATRYSGHYHGLPRVHAWELYNEPNFGQSLSPQSVGSVLTSADMYRGLVKAGWSALQATGHGHDTILIGALSAHGQDVPRVFGEAKPLQFIRELYCVDSGYHPFRGKAAAQRGCPASGAAFRRDNPGLFGASGFGIHPYPLSKDLSVPPNRTRLPDKDYAGFSQLGNVATALDRALRAEGSGKHFPIWNTEYGYITSPPTAGGVTWDNQAYYLNWAEYLSWRNPRVVSFMQFLLEDPPLPSRFASGLLTQGGDPKPSLDAWRLPLYLPSTSARRGRKLEIWGCVRPAQYAIRDTHAAQVGHIQFKANGGSLYSDVATVTFRNPTGSCYFDLHLAFPSSGTVRLTYSYPLADLSLLPTFAQTETLQPAVSRAIAITVS